MAQGQDELLLRSQHIRYFQRYGELYAYHNRFGFILGMSADVAAFLEYHAGSARGQSDRRSRFEGQFDPEQIDEFTAIFRIHQCLVESDEVERVRAWTMVPIKAPWVVFHVPDESTLTFWRTPRGGGPTADPQPAWAATFWARIDGEQRLSALCEGLVRDGHLDGAPATRELFLDHVFAWIHHDRQYLKLSFGALSKYGPPHRWPPYLRSTMPYEPWDPQTEPSPRAVLEEIGVPLAPPHAYYADEVAEAADQFRTVETTLSHLFRFPHAALGGKTYAERLGEALEKVHAVSPHTRDVVEIGGGLGHVAAGLIAYLRARWPDGLQSYTIVDLSPELARAQRDTLIEAGHADLVERGVVRWLCEDAERLSLPPECADLVISNEVIGDLTTVRLRRADVDEEATDLGPHARIVRELGLGFPDAPDEFYVNVGALGLVRTLALVLRPAATALLTEYGDAHRYPVASTQLDHLEFSIMFGPLIEAARFFGLEAHLHMLQDVIQLNRSIQTLTSTRTYFANLRALFASLGSELDKRAYTRDELQRALGDTPLTAIGELRFDAVDQRVMGLAPHEFRALLLTRPASAE